MSKDTDPGPASPARLSTSQLVRELASLQVMLDVLRAELDELRESQNLLESSRDDYVEIHDLAPVVLLTLGKDGTIRSANLAAAELFEEERSSLIHRKLSSFVHDHDRAPMAEYLGQQGRASRRGCEVRLLVKSGSVAPVQLWARTSSRRPGVQHVTLLDLRERELDAWEKRQLADAARRARSAVNSKDQFIAMLSHELRTPLTPVLAAASALKNAPGVATELRDVFAVIERNVTAEARLIDDLLDATGMARGKLRVERRPLELHALVNECLDGIRAQAERKGLSLSFVPAAEQSWVSGDALRLRQVLSNLLSNAVKFTPPGGQVCLRSWNSGDELALEVQDDGIGFNPEQAAQLFTAFERLHGGSANQAGLGLGLALCKGLVELHGGQITAQSPGPDRGARFVIQLPAAPAVVQAEASASSEPERVAPQASDVVPRRNILVVEDHADTAEMLRILLEEHGYGVVTADCVAAARAADLSRIDAIICDIGLPDGSGLELLRSLARKSDQPAIVLSGHGMPSDIKASQLAGFARHLLKPIDFAELLRSLDELLAHVRCGEQSA